MNKLGRISRETRGVDSFPIDKNSGAVARTDKACKLSSGKVVPIYNVGQHTCPGTVIDLK